MPTQPFTHHEILGLIQPFTQRGRRLDLGASDRLERQLRFQPVEHAGREAGVPALRDQLQLENPWQGTYRLTRTLGAAGGLQATLVAEGPEPAALLARIESVESHRPFVTGPGFEIARSYGVEGPADAAPLLMLTQAVACLDGLTLTLSVPARKGIPAELVLRPTDGVALELPQDLLAVLGWHWSCLHPGRDGWTGSIRLRGQGSERSRDAEAKLEAAARHLARTLAEPPARFHELRARARWGVVLRRAMPLLFIVGLMAGIATLSQFELAQDSVVRVLLFHIPALLLMLSFGMREIPRIEIPPLPRASRLADWRKPRPAARA
jgi:hypothetical protein